MVNVIRYTLHVSIQSQTFQIKDLVVYGQKTSQAFASALDRVNVARLVNYMRFNLDNLSRGFLFEQNDKITRDNIRDAVERFCG